MKNLLLLLPLLLAGCAELKPSWQGFYGGVTTAAPFTTAPSQDNTSVTGCAIIGLGKKNSALLEVYQPVNGSAPGYMFGVSRRIF